MTLSGPDGSERWTRKFRSRPVGIAVGAFVVLTLIVATVALSGSPEFSPTPLESTQASQPPASTSTSGSGEVSAFELFDDFSAEGFDPNKWTRDNQDATFISSRDGAAHLEAPVQINSEGDAETLRARLPRPVAAVRFQMTLLSTNGPNDGGAYVIVSSGSGRHHKVIMGPSSEGAGSAGYYICAREAGCRDAVYEDFEHPVADPNVVLGQPYEMTIRQSGEDWLFELDGQQRAVAEQEPGPITDLSLYLYSFGGGTFHATVDNVFVKYAT